MKPVQYSDNCSHCWWGDNCNEYDSCCMIIIASEHIWTRWICREFNNKEIIKNLFFMRTPLKSPQGALIVTKHPLDKESFMWSTWLLDCWVTLCRLHYSVFSSVVLFQVKCIILQLLRGLEYLHHNFIIHRSVPDIYWKHQQLTQVFSVLNILWTESN